MIASQHRRFRQYLEEPAVQKRNLRSSFPFLFLSGFCFFTPRELCSRRMENGDLRAVFLATGKMRGRRLSITGNGVTSRWHSRIFPLTPTRLRSALHFYKCVADLVWNEWRTGRRCLRYLFIFLRIKTPRVSPVLRLAIPRGNSTRFSSFKARNASRMLPVDVWSERQTVGRGPVFEPRLGCPVNHARTSPSRLWTKDIFAAQRANP